MTAKQTQECFKCSHFYITWEKDLPNGCRLYRIKTKYIPSKVVLTSTGTGCIGFTEKTGKKK